LPWSRQFRIRYAVGFAAQPRPDIAHDEQAQNQVRHQDTAGEEHPAVVTFVSVSNVIAQFVDPKKKSRGDSVRARARLSNRGQCGHLNRPRNETSATVARSQRAQKISPPTDTAPHTVSKAPSFQTRGGFETTRRPPRTARGRASRSSTPRVPRVVGSQHRRRGRLRRPRVTTSLDLATCRRARVADIAIRATSESAAAK